jgi:3-hydroxyisobutyrate dehydrogenase-like beta-hydroxyacid dehydrogenase
MSHLGFIGVGFMGHGMAANLLKHGHRVTVVANRNRAPVEDLVRRGAREAASIEDLAKGQDGVFICVTNTPAVEAVIERLLPVLTPGQTVIDTGTSRPDSTLAIAKRLAAAGVRFVDAPMGGGAQQAEAGELASLVGGSLEDFARVEPWVGCYSRITVHMGTVGAAMRAKLLNNLLALGQAALVLEAYAIARAEGLDWEKLYRVNMGGAARSGSLERIMVPALKGDFGGYIFSVENAEKDLSYYVEFARSIGRDNALGEAFRAYFERAAHERGRDTLLSELLKPQ